MSAQVAVIVSPTSATAPSRIFRMTPAPGDDQRSSMQRLFPERCSLTATSAADLRKTTRIKRSRRPTEGAYSSHCSSYRRLASASARLQPERLPRASSRLARAKAPAKFVCARSSARFTELGVGW